MIKIRATVTPKTTKFPTTVFDCEETEWGLLSNQVTTAYGRVLQIVYGQYTSDGGVEELAGKTITFQPAEDV